MSGQRDFAASVSRGLRPSPFSLQGDTWDDWAILSRENYMASRVVAEITSYRDVMDSLGEDRTASIFSEPFEHARFQI
ncbi:hypothetical protein FPOAC1_005165 [Fusarium poae]|uniref:hypothetical protein n=1 Tax=Fusarium poae TaxID=36050 RepID=UPI001CEB87FF|nr:hypothetical protein FPOAC1_005165 [Fusarium poae]KAG8671907.1 hypothetical protein FPOAC1_005165 [Fusarium poae]